MLFNMRTQNIYIISVELQQIPDSSPFIVTSQVHIIYFQVYASLKYKLSLVFPFNYPYVAPTIKFDTPCYHPNVDQHGNICLDILKEKWSALYDVRTVLLSIQSLLAGQLRSFRKYFSSVPIFEKMEKFKDMLRQPSFSNFFMTKWLKNLKFDNFLYRTLVRTLVLKHMLRIVRKSCKHFLPGCCCLHP